MYWNRAFAVMLLVIVVPATISQGNEDNLTDPVTEIVLPEELDIGAESIPAPSSADSEQIVTDWLASRPLPTASADPPKYITSLCAILISVWLMILVGCLGWWRRNVQQNNQDT